jgi:hypothetical protein
VETAPEGRSTLILVTHEGMGQTDPPLQRKLFRTYLTLLLENDTLPGAIAFYADGVKLVVKGSPVIDILRRVGVGIVGGMGDIIAAQWKAAKVITI